MTLSSSPLLGLALVCAGCASSELKSGPGLAADAPPTRVVIEPIEKSDGRRAVLTDAASMRTSQRLFSAEGWEQTDDELVPHYRVHVTTPDGHSSTFFIGTFSDPPRPPCFSLCSGFWASAATPDGRPLRGMRRALATSRDMFAVSQLLEHAVPVQDSPPR